VGFTGGTGGQSASQKILTWTFVSSAPLITQTPIISPKAGAYSSQQSITISDPTPNAAIYYTLDGSTPSTASSLYASPLIVGNGTTTVSAIAVGIGATASPVAVATFTVTLPVAAAPCNAVSALPAW